MEQWYPDAIQIDRGGGVPMGDGPTVVVLHSTETDGPASYSGTEPHFEVYVSPFGNVQVRQFIALSNTAKALYNAPGGVETNRRSGHVIQIEIVGRAAEAADWPDARLAAVADVIRWVRTQLPFALNVPPRGFHGAGEGFVLATETSPIRFTFAEWVVFEGLCGHQHLPENDHWDPGKINIVRLIELIGGIASQEDNMVRRYAHQGNIYVTDFVGRRYVNDGLENDALQREGVNMLDWSAAEIASLHDSLVDLDAVWALIRSSNGELAQLAVVIRDPNTGIGKRVGDLVSRPITVTPTAVAEVQAKFGTDTLAAIAKAVNDDAARRRGAWS
jgi:hypothetical protein